MSRPNFVFIMTDTQGANVIGSYGHPGTDTPCIDKLAKTGTRFTRAYTTCPLCTPARAGIFTGIYPHTAGAWTNNLPLGDNIKTMGHRFQDAGYRTAYVGKWHLDGHDYFGAGICPDGWEETRWYDGKRYLEELSDNEIALWRSGLSTVEELHEHDIHAEFTWAHRISNRAIDFLETRTDAPYVLVVSYDEPHHPFTCPPEYAEKYADYEYPVGPAAFDTLENKPAHQREWAASDKVALVNGRMRHPLYFGCNSFVDDEIGRVIDAAHEYSPDNTYCIFTSDHGDMLGAHGLHGKGPVMYEEITHVPLIIEQPGQKGAGEINSTLVSHIDLLPTMLEIAGLETPPILEGQSIVSMLQGQEDSERDVIMEFNRYEIEHDSWGGFQPVGCVVNDQYKLVLNLLHTDELYDLKEDPAEVNNLIDQRDHAHIRDEIHMRLLNWMYEKRDPFRGPCRERRPWQETRRLQWRGAFRPRPADGYAPEVREYDTGMPAHGPKNEFGGRKVLKRLQHQLERVETRVTNSTVQIGSLEVSRLIVGGNPFSGISHQSPQRDLEMMRYYTSARVQETLREAENVGVNTFLARADRYIMRLLLEYRQAGGGIQWFAQTCSEYGAIDRSVQHARMADAQACYIHGGVMDRLLAQNQLAEVPALITQIRNAGLVVGIAGHNPAVFEWAEEYIDVDFYMCSYYNPSRGDEHAEHRAEAIECFADEDRQLMVRVIAQLSKPAIHYKIMAAGRKNPEDAFAFVAQHLRPQDAVCIGVFTQEYSSMPADDLELLQQSLRTAGVCEQSGRQ